MCHRAHKRLQVPQLTSFPLVQLVVRLPEHKSQRVVVCYDKELRATFKVTPQVLYRLTFGQSLQIVRKVGVAGINWVQLPRP
jgi:hypothetical protein